MAEILALLQVIAPLVSKTTLRQMSQVVYGLLVTNRRVSMLELARWTEGGGSYRTLQRWYQTAVPWVQVMWLLFSHRLWHAGHTYIAAGDEVVFGKAGQATYGLGSFFSSLQQRVIPGLSFFALALIDVQDRRAYPLHVAQVIKPGPVAQIPNPAASVAGPKRAVGRPKGSKTKPRVQPSLSPELLHVQLMLQSFLSQIAGRVQIKYLVLDGHFGNSPCAGLVVRTGLHLISKLRQDAALFEPFSGVYRGSGRHPKYGPRLDLCQPNPKYLQSDSVTNGLRTQIYQAPLLNRAFDTPLNVVILLKTNLATQAHAHAILFTTDLTLAPETVIDYYALRFQIEFNFRDAKQYWGLDDFMNVTQTAVTNAAQLAFFMVNFSAVLLRPFRQLNPAFSILDLKSHYRGQRYVAEILKLLPQKPQGILLTNVFEQIARLGMLHPPLEPSPIP
jgi:putative transposase